MPVISSDACHALVCLCLSSSSYYYTTCVQQFCLEVSRKSMPCYRLRLLSIMHASFTQSSFQCICRRFAFFFSYYSHSFAFFSFGTCSTSRLISLSTTFFFSHSLVSFASLVRVVRCFLLFPFLRNPLCSPEICFSGMCLCASLTLS